MSGSRASQFAFTVLAIASGMFLSTFINQFVTVVTAILAVFTAGVILLLDFSHARR